MPERRIGRTWIKPCSLSPNPSFRLFNFMGMYQRMEYMKVNGFLDDHTSDKGIVLPMSELCYVYKITSNFTGHFYIGQCNNIKNRMYSHLEKVLKIIEGIDCDHQKVHQYIANSIKEKYDKESLDKRKKIKIEKFTRDALTVYIYAVVSDREVAKMVESHFIKKYINDNMCLNVAM